MRVNQYYHQKGVKKDTNLMIVLDSLLLDNPYGSMVSPEEQSLEKLEQRQPSLELGTPGRSQGRGWCHAPGIFHLPLYLLSTSSRLTQDIKQETRDSL